MIESPLPGYNFIVTLDPADAYLPAAQALLLPLVAAGAFQEVKGLGADLELMAYPEGGVNEYVHQLPVRHSWSRISLRRGVLSSVQLWTWYQTGLRGSLGARRDGCIIMLKPSGAPAMAWMWKGGLAVKWQGPELNAMQNTVAIEGIEIAHEGLTQVPLSFTDLE